MSNETFSTVPTADEIYEDPVRYLRSLGITAELVSLPALPAAA